jgi:hypothetical protein
VPGIAPTLRPWVSWFTGTRGTPWGSASSITPVYVSTTQIMPTKKKSKKAPSPRKKPAKGKKPAKKQRAVSSKGKGTLKARVENPSDNEGKILAKFAWEPSKPTDRQAMESVFNMQQEKGRFIYTTDSTWKPVAKLNKFDGTLGRMVVLPRPTVYDHLEENTK